MADIISLLENYSAIKSFCKGEKNTYVTDDVIGTSLLVSSRFMKKKGKLAVITSNLYNAQRVYDFISNVIGEENCLFFPSDEMIRNDSIATSKEMVAQRLYILNELMTRNDYVLITHVSAASRYLPSPSLFKENVLKLKVNDVVDLNSLKARLIKMGYTSVHKIDHSLQFASRGDILDVFSVNSTNPIRIEFFDNEIESIRLFSCDTQQSNEAINEAIILPANENILSDSEVNNAAKKLEEIGYNTKKQLDDNKTSCQKIDVQELIEDIKEFKDTKFTRKFYSVLQEKHYSIFDFISDSQIIEVNKEQIRATNSLLQDEAYEYVKEQVEKGELITFIHMFQDVEQLLKNKRTIKMSPFATSSDYELFQISSIPSAASTLQKAYELILNYINIGSKIIISLDSKQQACLIEEILKENGVCYEHLNSFSVPSSNVGIICSSLDEGFEIIKSNIVFLTSRELFSYKVKSSKFVNRYKEAVALKSEQDLVPGDYIVHEQHGVGKYIDIVTKEFDGIHRDFIHIQYAGSDVLYVPLEQFRLLKKFSCREGAAPKLNKLGSGEWDKTKKKIKEKINDMADRLFKLYAERELVEGFAFEKDNEFQYEFERQFPYPLTEDQEKCLIDIKKDMESHKPMDRLLCGDVGFGKTEIAFRAAFKAMMSGKQVAILCPTTLLARQHYERAKERFGAFDVNVVVFSRLIDEQKDKHFKKLTEDGKAHLIIGTHRLLSKEIKFNNLGLLIIDEEQRFGVEQKEKIKEMRNNLDVLTLTATPIPRTLQMSLLGVRSLSQINTAPKNRMPIQTYVIPQKDDVVFELIARELGRKGQVFYLHNNVTSIYGVANKISNKIKSCRIGVVHGQMDRNNIEDIMLNFYNGELDVLVCTSIIETGIDIPNVNMIIIEDADKFGLSQLYQIKGRVGRGDRIAYAYLLYKPNKALTETAQKRLKAITDFTELGSGYKIAQRDLLIRGAGDILGPEQAGFIDTVGIDMYMQLLQESIEERKNGAKSAKKQNKGNIVVDGYLPTKYIEKVDKIDLYQEIDAIKSLDELNILKEKVKDIYGRLPKEVINLFEKRELLFVIEQNEMFEKIDEEKTFVDILLSHKFSNIDSIGVYLFRALTDYLRYIKVTYRDRQIKIRVIKNDNWFKIIKAIVVRIINLEKTL